MKRILTTVIAAALCMVLFGCVQPDPQPTEPTGTTQTVPETSQTAPSETQPAQTQPTQTQPTEPAATEPPEEASLITGEIYITTSAALSTEYTQAQMRVKWNGGGIEEQTVRIKLRGNLSLTDAEKKSYNVKFDEKVSFMGMDAGKKWSLLANHFDKSLLRTTIGFEYAQNIGIAYVSQTRLCRLWLDGTYMGVYTAIEPVDVGADLVDIDINSGDFLIERNSHLDRTEEDVTYITTNAGLRFEINEPETPSDAQVEAFLATLNQIEAAITSMDHTQYDQYIDVASFVDYYILHELIKDVDFGALSVRYYLKDGILYAGPPWDMDLTMGNVSVRQFQTKYLTYNNQNGLGNGSGDSTQGFWAADKDFYTWLTQDEHFMALVKVRWQELKPVTENLVRDNELGQCRIDWYVEQAGQLLESNYGSDGAGWSVSEPAVRFEYTYPAADYAGNVDYLKQWLTDRMAWLDAQFAPESP